MHYWVVAMITMADGAGRPRVIKLPFFVFRAQRPGPHERQCETTNAAAEASPGMAVER